MSLQGLEERLTDLQETTTQLRELIDRLANLEFQPGSVPLETNEENIGQILRNGLDEQELLQEEVNFVRPEGTEKARLKEVVERLGAELSSCRGRFRKARLSAREKLLQARKLERQLLIQSYSVPVSEPTSQGESPSQEAPTLVFRPQRHIHQAQNQSSLSEGDQQTVGASSNVTNALRRTHDLIAAELYRSEYAHQTLTESSAALKQLNESYSSLDTMLASSRDLLGTLLRSQKSDTWYLQTAMYMLIVTGAWLLFRRLLYGPMWWLVWLPLRILFGVGSKAGSAVMHRSGPGESEKVAAGDTGKVSVDGLPSEDVPTAKVAHTKIADPNADSDSMAEKVARVIDAANEADDLGNMDNHVDGEGDEQPGNPKKRMWEEPEVVRETQHRDEL